MNYTIIVLEVIAVMAILMVVIEVIVLLAILTAMILIPLVKNPIEGRHDYIEEIQEE